MDATSGSLTIAGEPRTRKILRLWLSMVRCVRSVEQRLKSHLAEDFDVTLPQFEVLAALERIGEPEVMSRLSERLGVTGSNLTGVVDRLEGKGLVRRFGTKKDRRIQLVAMTPKGRELHAEVAADNAEWVARVFTGLKDEEVLELLELIRKADRSALKALV